MSSNPRAWGRYRALVDSGVLSSSATLSRFAARYRMARDLDTITFRTLSSSTATGYGVLLQVGLAYSALEALESAIEPVNRQGKKQRTTSVAAPEVLRCIRGPRMSKFRDSLVTPVYEHEQQLCNRVAAVLDNSADDNARPIAEKVRHLFFHGVMTVHGTGLTTQTTQAVMHDLSEAVIVSVDDRFTRWVAGSEDRAMVDR